MTGSRTRRETIRALGALSLLPFLPLQARASAASSANISPPATPMRFTRKLTRELSGGYSVVTTRSFEIAFSRQDHGFVIEGGQVAALVEAPANLEAFARIERERIERGLFPMQLDWSGVILSCPDSVPSTSLPKAVDVALSRIAAMAGEAEAREDARAFVLQLQQVAGQISNEPPADLFVPPSAAEKVSRSLSLPGGDEGLVTSEFSGTISSESGLMESAMRVIATATGGSVRRTLEQWSLGPIS